MSDSLKPVHCGCGGEAVLETDHDTIQPVAPIDWKRVRCNKCNIRTTWRRNESEAIEAWNKAMGGVVSYPCTNSNGVYTNGCTITNTTDPSEDFHPIRDCMVGVERTVKVRDKKNDPMVDEWYHGRCMNCGKQVRRRDNYCSRCGGKLEWNND